MIYTGSLWLDYSRCLGPLNQPGSRQCTGWCVTQKCTAVDKFNNGPGAAVPRCTAAGPDGWWVIANGVIWWLPRELIKALLCHSCNSREARTWPGKLQNRIRRGNSPWWGLLGPSGIELVFGIAPKTLLSHGDTPDHLYTSNRDTNIHFPCSSDIHNKVHLYFKSFCAKLEAKAQQNFFIVVQICQFQTNLETLSKNTQSTLGKS